MVALTTLILEGDGSRIAPLGKFLHPPDWPFLTVWSLEGPAQIRGAALTRPDELEEPVLEVLVADREKAPLICLASTRVRIMGTEEDNGPGQRWLRADRLAGQTVMVPERLLRTLAMTWKRVKQVRRAPEGVWAIWPGTPAVAGTLVLQRGRFSFATPAAFVACLDDLSEMGA